MFRGLVTFRADFTGISFDPLEIAPPIPEVSMAKLKSSPNEEILLEVEIIDAGTTDVALGQAREVAAYITRIMTFKFRKFHQPFCLIKDALVEERLLPDGSIEIIPYIILTAGSGGGGNIEILTHLGSQDRDEFKTFLEQNYSSSHYYDLFHFSLGLTDPIAKFMSLYSIVLSLCNDNQKAVDKAIISIQPTVQTFQGHKNVTETIYTKLRNEVAHIRPGTTIKSTRCDMETNLPRFIDIVQRIIEWKS